MTIHYLILSTDDDTSDEFLRDGSEKKPANDDDDGELKVTKVKKE